MIGLALRALKAHPARFLGPGIALAMVATAAAASGMLLESALRTNPTHDAFASASVVVAGQQVRPSDDSGSYEGVSVPDRVPVPDDARSRLEALGSIAEVVEFTSTEAVLSSSPDAPRFPAVVESASMAAVEGTVLSAGRHPAALHEAVIPGEWASLAGAGVGDSVTVRTVARDLRLIVVGVSDTRVPAGLPVPVIMSDAANARLAGSGAPADFLAVLAEQSASTERVVSQVRRALAGSPAAVLTPEEAAVSASMEVVSARQNLADLSGTFAGLTLLVGVFVAVSTLALAASQSARDIALLRAIGATPQQVRRLMVSQSVIVAVVSGIVGSLAARWLARMSLTSLHDHDITPAFVTVQYTWIPVVSTIGGVVAVALLASVIATRKTTQIRPVEALRDSAGEVVGVGLWRLAIGIAVLGGAAIVSQVRMPGGGGTNQAATASLVVLALMVAIGILGPLLAKIGSLVLSPMVRIAGRVGQLAASNTRYYARRTASATTAIALLVSLAALTVFVPSVVTSATQAAAAEREQGSWRISNALGLLPTDVLKAERAQGVSAAIGLQHTVVIHGRTSTIDFNAVSVFGSGLTRVLNLGVTSGSIPSNWDNGIVLSEQVAKSWAAAPGDRVEVLLADGQIVQPEVIATFSRSIGFADVLMPWSMSTDRGGGIDEVRVRADSDDATVEAVQAALGESATPVVVAEAGNNSLDEDTALNLWLTRRLLVLVCVMAAVAVVTTLVMVTLSRRREVAALRLIGATGLQTKAMIGSESLAVWGVGTAQGLAVACIALLPLVRALPGGRIEAVAMSQMLAVVLTLGLICAASSAAALRASMRGSPLATAALGPT
ncbi:MAG TPA: FtsX-like permease family protein [Nocardioidaceae bacterium]|nr:FtsX-like permease family protein [Nocardioidaceae bacterium]